MNTGPSLSGLAGASPSRTQPKSEMERQMENLATLKSQLLGTARFLENDEQAIQWSNATALASIATSLTYIYNELNQIRQNTTKASTKSIEDVYMQVTNMIQMQCSLLSTLTNKT
jgi:histone deacetylase complex regulatory component SIN3